MKNIIISLTATLALILPARAADVSVKLTGVHLCCQGCVNAAEAALTSVEGVNSRCDMENGTVTFTASDDAAA